MLCNCIEHDETKMLDVEKHIFSLKVKWMSAFLDNSFASQWKFVESVANAPISNCVISSNLNIEHVQIKKFFELLRKLINAMQ